MSFSTIFGKATKADLTALAKTVRHVKSLDTSIKIQAMGSLDKWKIISFGDAGHANVDEVFSSLGKLVCWVGDENKASALSWSANKAERVARSPLAAEVMGSIEAVEEGVYCRKLVSALTRVTEIAIQLVHVTDSKSLKVAVDNSGSMKDKRCKIDFAALREGYERGEYQIWWKKGKNQVADVLTKPNVVCLAMETLLGQGFYKHKLHAKPGQM